MLKLNILSQDLKKEIKLLAIYKFLKRLGFLLFSILIIYSVTFQGSKFILQKYSSDSYNSEMASNKNSDEYIKKVKEINEKIENVSAVQKDSVIWSNFIINISSLINNDIVLNQLTIDKKTDTFAISGIAKTRDSLLALKANLEELDYLSEIDLPISSLLKKDEINFNIKAVILNYEF